MFCWLIAIAYGIWTDIAQGRIEVAGFAALILSGGLLGIAGSFFLAFGLLLILLGVLRLLQTETGTALDGDWSWVPYAVVVVLGIAVIAVAGLRIQAGPGQRKLPEVIARRESREIEAQEGTS